MHVCEVYKCKAVVDKFLPPANEVLGKVMFSEAFAILFTGRGGGYGVGLCMMSLPVLLPGTMLLLGDLC